jgi:hypothetical protein
MINRFPTIAFLALAALTLPTASQAQSCAENFTMEGTPLLTALNFRTSQNFPGVDHRKALTSLRQGLLAEGFSNIDVDRSGGALTAVQETSGSGRPQTLRVTARKVGNATRVDADTVRGAMCRVVGSARL